MKKFKYWFACKCIDLCNYCLSFSDGAKDQEDINEVVAMKNYFIRQRDKLSV